MFLAGNDFWFQFPSVLADKIRFVLDDSPSRNAKISEINIHKEGMKKITDHTNTMTIYSVPMEFRQEAVRLYSSSGSYENTNPASRVLFYSPTDDDFTAWIAAYSADVEFQWFVLDLSTEMSFDAVNIANSVCKPHKDGYTKDFR